MNNMYAHVCTVEYFDEIAMKETSECILIQAANYHEALSVVEDWYGEDNINKISMEAFDVLIKLTPEAVEKIRNDEAV